MKRMQTKNNMKSIQLFALTFLTSMPSLFAMGSRPTDPNTPPPPAWVQFFPMLVMVAVFYFRLIRPQIRQRKERDRMMGGIKKGDHIVTQGGVFATVVNINPDSYEVKINDETKIKIRKSAVTEVLPAESKAEIVAAGQ